MKKYIVYVKMDDGSRKEFVSSNFHEIGSYFKGGEVMSCANLSRIY